MTNVGDIILLIVTLILLITIGVFNILGARALDRISNRGKQLDYAHTMLTVGAVLSIVGAAAILIATIAYFVKKGKSYTFALAMVIITLILIFIITILSAIAAAFINTSSATGADRNSAYRNTIISTIVAAFGFAFSLILLLLIERNKRQQQATNIKNELQQLFKGNKLNLSSLNSSLKNLGLSDEELAAFA